MKTLKALTVGLFVLALMGTPAFAETCCEKAKAKGEECKHKCCVAAAKDGKTCEKCNPKTDNKEGEKK
jgi:hypothetical protein